jgi:uncharacterized membrane protein HdeD (DUF308 family)
MIAVLAGNWWVLALRGLAAVIFGLLAFFWPDHALPALVVIFGVYALVDGVFGVVAAVSGSRGRGMRWLLLLEGIAGIAIGIISIFWPGTTALVLLYFIAAWAIITGIFEIMTAVELRREINNEWFLALSGGLSVAFGLLLVVFPVAGAVAFIWLIGAYALLFGALLIMLAFQMRAWGERLRRT